MIMVVTGRDAALAALERTDAANAATTRDDRDTGAPFQIEQRSSLCEVAAARQRQATYNPHSGNSGFHHRYLSRQFALGSLACSDADALALVQLAYPAPPQRLHVNEYIRRVGSTGNKSVSLAAIEPLDRGIKRR